MAQLRGLCKAPERGRAILRAKPRILALLAGPRLEVALQAALRVAAVGEQLLDLLQRDLALEPTAAAQPVLGSVQHMTAKMWSMPLVLAGVSAQVEETCLQASTASFFA